MNRQIQYCAALLPLFCLGAEVLHAQTVVTPPPAPSVQPAAQQTYPQTVSAWLAKFVTYSSGAYTAAADQTAILRIRLSRDGKVQSSELYRTSGNAWLDDTALRAAQAANPFPPAPEAFKPMQQSLEFLVPVTLKPPPL